MSDKQSFHSNFQKAYQKKRGSVDSIIRPDKKMKNNDHRDSKKDISELVIDLNTGKNISKLSLNRNLTHRIQTNQNLCELREQVEQLRMQNQSLREQIKLLKNAEGDLKYQIATLKKQVLTEQEKNNKIQLQCARLQQKVSKYSEKIKQLFESLIHQKRKNAGLDQDQDQEIVKVKMALSPSNLSLCNSLNLRKFQEQGYKDFFNSMRRNHIPSQFEKNIKFESFNKFKKAQWSLESSGISPGHRIKGSEIYQPKY